MQKTQKQSRFSNKEQGLDTVENITALQCSIGKDNTGQRSEQTWGLKYKEIEGVEGTARGLETCGDIRVKSDQGGAWGARETGRASGMTVHGGDERAWSKEEP